MITLDELLKTETDGMLLDMYYEISSGVVPATGYSRAYCRKVNRMIDAGAMQINATSYRKVYMPSLSRAVLREMARRYAWSLIHAKGPSVDAEVI